MASEPEIARDYLTTSVMFQRGTNNLRDLSRALCYMANCLIILCDVAAGMEAAEEALAIATRRGADKEAILSHVDLGRLATLRGDTLAAEQHFGEGGTMGEAEFVIGKDERTRGGSLPGPVLEKVAEIIQQGGFVLLPSDTCYSIAAQPPRSEEARRRINALLGRTVICAALHEERVLPGFWFEDSIKVMDRTIGVRIPDFVIEREAAASTEFPVTTVAVRTSPGYQVPIQDFPTAYDTVSAGLNGIAPMRWAAIEGSDFYLHNSTIVRVPGVSGIVDHVRAGDISLEKIKQRLDHCASTAALGTSPS